MPKRLNRIKPSADPVAVADPPQPDKPKKKSQKHHPRVSAGPKLRSKLREQKLAVFIKLLAECGNVSRAVQGAGMSNADRVSLYRIRRQDAEFAEAWDEAAAMGVMALEDEMRRRAFEGVEEPVIYKGKIAKDENGVPLVMRKYSDNLLMFALKGAKPDKYRDKPAVLSANASSAAAASAAIDVEIRQGREGMYADLVKRARDRENAN